MNDREIVELYLARDESAVEETGKRYGKYLRALAKSILGSDSDAEECENDVYLEAWNSIPPHEPEPLKPFLAMLCRRIALNRCEKMHTAKRGGGQIPLIYEELEGFVALDVCEDPAEKAAFKETLEHFLLSLDATERILFIRRYWYMCSVEELAGAFKLSKTNVAVRLFRVRKKMKDFFISAGYRFE